MSGMDLICIIVVSIAVIACVFIVCWTIRECSANDVEKIQNVKSIRCDITEMNTRLNTLTDSVEKLNNKVLSGDTEI